MRRNRGICSGFEERQVLKGSERSIDVVEMGEAEDCRLAFQAAMDLIQEKCGVEFPQGAVRRVEISGTTVLVPKEVTEIAASNPELTRPQRVEAVAASTWAQSWAKGMVGLVSPGLTEKEREEAVGRLSRKLAERVV